MHPVTLKAFQDELQKLAAKDDKKKKSTSGSVVDTVAKGLAGTALAAGGLGAAALGTGHVLRSESRHGELLKALSGIQDTLKSKNQVTDAVGAVKTIAKVPFIHTLIKRFGKKATVQEDAFSDEIRKLAVSPGKAVQAIFNRVYKGKQVGPTITRMAKNYVETADRMGSPVTREGVKSWIKQVKSTKSL